MNPYKTEEENMSKYYYTIYRCRMCGEEFASRVIANSEAAIEQMVHITAKCEIKKWAGIPITETSMHSCADGALGMADFIGFKKGGESGRTYG